MYFPIIEVSLSRSASRSENYSDNNGGKSEEDMKIEEAIALLVKRELEGEEILKCWTYKHMVILHLNVLKELKSLEGIFSL